MFCTAANDADVVQGQELLHGQDSAIHDDSGYTGLDRRDAIKAAQDACRLGQEIAWHIAMKRGQLKAMPAGPAKALYEWFERRKAQIRAIVEHPFRVIKNLLGYRKVSYRCIAKNEVGAKAQAALAVRRGATELAAARVDQRFPNRSAATSAGKEPVAKVPVAPKAKLMSGRTLTRNVQLRSARSRESVTSWTKPLLAGLTTRKVSRPGLSRSTSRSAGLASWIVKLRTVVP